MASHRGAVVFDIDGTLLDSVDQHARAWVEAFAHFGIHAEEAEVRHQIGKGGDQLLPVFVDRDRLAREGKTIEAYRSDLFKRRYLDQVRPFPGVQELLSRLREDGLAVALASSGKASEVENYQRILGIEGLVDAVTSADDADRSKPHPDIFEAVLEKLPGLPKAAVIAVGDTPYDAEPPGRPESGPSGSCAAASPRPTCRPPVASRSTATRRTCSTATPARPSR